jgi:dihydrofolate synthase / folylpolyglutamate synthase
VSTGSLEQAWGGRVSEWEDPLDGPMAEIAARYGLRVPRSDVAQVDRLRAALELPRPGLTVVVIGSNGKTSTATYLADLFSAAGSRTGLYTSPHIAYWTERVRIDDLPVEGEQLVGAVRDVDALARELELDELRFFDVLTLAAASVFAAGDVDVAIYEAGIGGRADTTRSLRPELVVLTTVSLEHTQLLGESDEEILRHKLDVAPPGATVVAAELPEQLLAVAREHADAIGARLLVPEVPDATGAGVPAYLARNWQLARAATTVGLDGQVSGGEPRDVYGRFTVVERDGVEYVVDVAHNPQAWSAFLRELRDRARGTAMSAVVAITAERQLEDFAAVVAESGMFDLVYVTRTNVRPTHDPDLVARALAQAGQRAAGIADPRAAFETARADGGRVAVFGSSYLVTDAMAWLDEAPRFGAGVNAG